MILTTPHAALPSPGVLIAGPGAWAAFPSAEPAYVRPPAPGRVLLNVPDEELDVHLVTTEVNLHRPEIGHVPEFQ